MKKILLIILLLSCSGCSLSLVSQPESKLVAVGHECRLSGDCILPGEYAIQSNCPYTAFCENQRCVIACPQWQDASNTTESISYKVACRQTIDCDCRNWDLDSKYRCACLESQCVSVVKDLLTPIIDEIKVPILIYHHIENELPPKTSSSRTFYVTPAEFEEQLKYLKENNFETISMAQLAQAFAGQFNLPSKPVVITFDDGLPSQYENALPLLEKYGFKAIFYIFTNPIGISKNYFTWEQVKDLSSKGMEIGSHTWYHHYLTKEEDLAGLKREIFGSKEKIEKELGIKVTSISYPFGDKDATSTAMIKAAGYLTARDIVNGDIQTAADILQLKSYFVTSDLKRFVWIVNSK